MSVERDHDGGTEGEASTPFARYWAWKGGAVAGLAATVTMGAVITAMDLSTLQLAIAGLYGQSGSLVVGWLAHLVHGSLFGVVFALVLADPGLHRLTEQHWKTAAAGVVFGLVLAVAGAGIIMPIWLGIAGFPTPPSVPFVTTPMLLWHLVYGLVLGSVFPLVEEL